MDVQVTHYAIGKAGEVATRFTTNLAAVVLADGEVAVALADAADQPHRITADGKGVEAIAPTIEERRATAWRAAVAYRDSFISRSLKATTAKGAFDFDDKGRANIEDAIEGAEQLGDQAPPTKSWRMADNSYVDVSVDDLRAARLAGILAKDACYQASWAIEAQQLAAAEPETVDITAGYPA